MADGIERFNVNIPAKYNGIEDFATADMKEFANEMQRRLETNQDAILNALRNQVVVQKSLLPLQVGGASQPSSLTLITNINLENSTAFNALWEG